MEKETTILRKYIRFFGRVQSCGFRSQAQHIAKRKGVTGWVQNQHDRSVVMEIQGTQQQINDVIAEIDSDPYIRIERMETKWLDPDPDERGFRVRH
jgi:Acylphosphatases